MKDLKLSDVRFGVDSSSSAECFFIGKRSGKYEDWGDWLSYTEARELYHYLHIFLYVEYWRNRPEEKNVD